MTFLERTASTNTAAADLLAQGRIKAPALVMTGHQTAGRGQLGRAWFSGRQSLAATFVLPIDDRRAIHHLPILVGLAVRKALAGLAGEIGLRVKWPNDILLSGRKVAGILCERKYGADIIGVGVNIRHDADEPPAELRDSIVALADAITAPDRWEVLVAIARSIRATLLEQPHDIAWPAALASWTLHDALLGRLIEVEAPQGIVSGRASGVDNDGRLRLIAPGGAMSIISGSVSRTH